MTSLGPSNDNIPRDEMRLAWLCAWRATNRDRINRWWRRWRSSLRASDPERLAARDRQGYERQLAKGYRQYKRQKAAWRLANADRIRTRKREWDRARRHRMSETDWKLLADSHNGGSK